MTNGAPLGLEGLAAAPGVSASGEELLGPDVADQLAPFLDVQLRRRLPHLRSMVPHGGGDIGEGDIAEPVFERQVAFVAVRAALVAEDGRALLGGRQDD